MSKRGLYIVSLLFGINIDYAEKNWRDTEKQKLVSHNAQQYRRALSPSQYIDWHCIHIFSVFVANFFVKEERADEVNFEEFRGMSGNRARLLNITRFPEVEILGRNTK